MLVAFRVYNNLLKEASILETQIELAIKERAMWHPVSGRLGQKVPLHIAAENIDRLSDQIEWMDEALAVKKQSIRHIEDKINSLDGLEYKVARMRFIEMKTLKEIANELGYAYDYIRQISSRVRDAL